MLLSGASSDDCARGGDTSSSRSLRPWPRLLTISHTGTEDGQGPEGGARGQARRATATDLPSRCSSACTTKSPAGGGLPAWQSRRPGPQERILQHTVEQFADLAPMVQILGAPVSQLVGQLVEVFRLIDTVVLDQVIDVPKITSQDIIPQRTVLRVPHMAEQLVDKPVPSFHEFEIFEEEEVEEEQPRVVPGSLIRDAAGHAWCRVTGPEEVHWWMIGTSTVQWTSPGQGGKKILAAVGTPVVECL